MSSPTSNYRRADIQGLRAVAVLAVLVYHLDNSWLPGGFVGVDIFFVLSGFLITQVLLRDVVEHGRPQFLKFWANRAKRLLPNAGLALVAVLVASYFLLPGYRLQAIAQDVQAAATFLANFHFEQRSVDYFHLGDPPSPVLHFWSLAVEEQFYLLFPFVIAAGAWAGGSGRIKRTVAVAALGIVVLSFAASLAVITESQPKAFYQPQYRAWQLAVGGLIACTYDMRHRLHGLVAHGLVWAGSAGVAGSLFLISEQTLYPGVWALLPTVSTGALLAALDKAPDHPMARLLSTRPAVVLGDLSYSLYLWHWPVIVLSAAHLDQSALTALINACVSLLLAYLAFVVVERPIHHARLGQAHIRTLAAAATCILAVWSGAVAFRLVPSPAVPGVEDKIIAATNDLGVNYAVGCHLGFDTTVQPDCAFGAVTSARRVVLFGDSHAAQWFSPLADAAAENGWRLETRTKTSCPAVEVIVWYRPTRSTYDECSLWRRDVLNSLASAPPELIVVASSSHYRDWSFDPGQATPAGSTQAKELWEDGALAVMDKLASTGASVIWIRDTPRMYTTFKDCLSAEPWDRCGRPRTAALDGMDVRSETLGQAKVLDLSEELCSRDICQATEGGEIMYRDEHHLTASQASKYARYFADLLPADISAGH